MLVQTLEELNKIFNSVVMWKKVFIFIILFLVSLFGVSFVFAKEGNCSPACDPALEYCFYGNDTCIPKGIDGSQCDGNWTCLSGKCAEKNKECFSILSTETRVVCGDYTCEKDQICDSQQISCVANTTGGATGGGSTVSGTVGPTIVSLVNPMGGEDADNKRSGDVDMRKILGNIIAKAMGMLGGVALLVFVYGGFEWLTSAGSPEKVKKGSQAMIWAVVGLFLIFGAYAIIRMFFTAIGAKESAYNPWGIENYSGTDTDKATEGCYCFEVTGSGNTGVKTPTKILQMQIPKEDCEKNEASRKNLVECQWQGFVSGEKFEGECAEGAVMVKGKCVQSPTN